MRRLLFLNGIKAFRGRAKRKLQWRGAELNVSAAAISRMVHLLSAARRRPVRRGKLAGDGGARLPNGLTPIFDALASHGDGALQSGIDRGVGPTLRCAG
jgi:LysR family glycine cleavage system transcriptional activator